MRLSTAALVVLGSAVSDAAFAPSIGRSSTARVSATPLFGYLDDLTDELYSEDDTPDIEGGKKENTNLTPEQKDRYGVGDWSSYVEFDEFDGGDGQMGVAGDGKKGLEKFGDDSSPSIVRNVDKSKARSAKNAWGTSTGYAEKIMEEGDGKVDIARAQQLENWQNQQQVRQKQIALNKMAEDFDAVTSAGDMDWRMLANFGVERNDDFNMDEEFGPVTPGDVLDGTIELSSRIGQLQAHSIVMKNPYMGYADFRAAFTSNTPMAWTVEPNEGNLGKSPQEFIIRFSPENPGVTEGLLVIETEDFKKTWKLIGSTA